MDRTFRIKNHIKNSEMVFFKTMENAETIFSIMKCHVTIDVD